MSYLDVPRIHFSGLFYTAPGNLNNDINNYNLENPLDFATGMYMYPDGTAQIYLSNCVVNSVVDSDGNLWSDPGHDLLVGASVTSPGPLTQKPDGKGGYYGYAKLVDLDPNMMSRSELYGFRIYVDFPGGGFSGPLAAPPQLRDLWFGRGNGKGKDKDGKQILNGLQVAVGTWHQRLTIDTWTKPPSDKSSPVWNFLNANSNAALDVKMSVDMFQTWRKNQFTEGDRFGYGRLVGVIGRALDGEPAELVPGRRLYAFQEQVRAAKLGPAMSREAVDEVMSEVEPSVTWNRADLRVCGPDDNPMLIVDLFNFAPLEIDGQGKLETGSEVVVCGVDGTNPKNVSFEYLWSDAATGKLKQAFWPAHSAIFQIMLTKEERDTINNKPLEIRVDGKTVLRENSNGVYVNIDRPSVRLEPNSKDEVFDVFSYTFGQPSASPKKDLTFQTNIYDDATEDENPTKIFTATAGEPTGRGRFQLHVKTGPAIPLAEMSALRKPLDSCLCLLEATGKDFQVGDAGDVPPLPFLSLLFWQNHKSVVNGEVIADPVWVNEEKEKKKDPDRRGEIYPIMQMYARLFPGMVSILDISNLATVKIHVDALIDRFSRDRTNPGFMPVSRDLSPSSVTMILNFLNRLKQEKP